MQVVSLVLAATTIVQAAPQDEAFTYLLQTDNTTQLAMPTKSYSGYLKVNDQK